MPVFVIFGDGLGLFSYLKRITLYLPEEDLSDYLLSGQRIQMEYIIDRLSGKKGLKDDDRVARIREIGRAHV